MKWNVGQQMKLVQWKLRQPIIISGETFFIA